MRSKIFKICMPERFNTNISHQFFWLNKITFVYSQHEHTNSKADNVHIQKSVLIKFFVLNISDWYTKINLIPIRYYDLNYTHLSLKFPHNKRKNLTISKYFSQTPIWVSQKDLRNLIWKFELIPCGCNSMHNMLLSSLYLFFSCVIYVLWVPIGKKLRSSIFSSQIS